MPTDRKIMAHIKGLQEKEQIVLPVVRRFLAKHPNWVPSPEAMAIIMAQLEAEHEAAQKPQYRTGYIHCSNAGDCLRRQTFDYLGPIMPRAVHELRTSLIFADGKFRHLKWQTLLYDAGIIDTIEYPLDWPRKNVVGSVDGAGTVRDDHPLYAGKDFGVEIKGSMSFAFASFVKKGPEKYIDQVTRYFLMSGWDMFVILMEHKDLHEMQEWVIFPDKQRLQDQRDEINAINRAARDKRLPPMLDDCKRQTGKVWKECAYGGSRTGVCPRSGDWPDQDILPQDPPF